MRCRINLKNQNFVRIKHDSRSLCPSVLIPASFLPFLSLSLLPSSTLQYCRYVFVPHLRHNIHYILTQSGLFQLFLCSKDYFHDSLKEEVVLEI